MHQPCSSSTKLTNLIPRPKPSHRHNVEKPHNQKNGNQRNAESNNSLRPESMRPNETQRTTIQAEVSHKQNERERCLTMLILRAGRAHSQVPRQPRPHKRIVIPQMLCLALAAGAAMRMAPQLPERSEPSSRANQALKQRLRPTRREEIGVAEHEARERGEIQQQVREKPLRATTELPFLHRIVRQRPVLSHTFAQPPGHHQRRPLLSERSSHRDSGIRDSEFASTRNTGSFLMEASNKDGIRHVSA